MYKLVLGKNVKISSLTCEEPRLPTGRDNIFDDISGQ